MTATQAAKALGVSSRAIKSLLTPTEWHHTSSYFNATDYYDVDSLLALKRSDRYEFDEDTWSEAERTLAELKARSQARADYLRWDGCTVEWLEWSGTRKHPIATERRESGCTMEWTGAAFCTVRLADGSLMKKKTDCKGFYVYDRDGERIAFRAD
jgi:hypothetical protein